MGSDIQAALKQLQELCTTIENWKAQVLPQAIYRAPIIDWHHPDDYTQNGIAGLRKFQSSVEAERDHVESLVNSTIRPKEFSTNSPHLLAVWHEFARAPWPLSAISHSLDVGVKQPVKVDIISKGGLEWVKINTIKESRLLSEFREQDSYVNSDYDSDTSSPGAGPSQSSAPITNSLIVLGDTLLRAASVHPRPTDQPLPTIRLVLTRLIRPVEGFQDDRIEKTISHLKESGILVQLGPSITSILSSTPIPQLRPTKNIVLDLSVLVALCCDSSHYPLPIDEDGFESRFRSRRICPETGEEVLNDHSHTSKDLRDQLKWEAQHPLIQEMKDRLGGVSAYEDGRDLRFWITEEVKGRLPGLVDIIGGPSERRRGKALLGDGGDMFWQGSRWEGNEGVLRYIKVGILEEGEDPVDPPNASEGYDRPEKESTVNGGGSPFGGGDFSQSPTAFQSHLASTCNALLILMDGPSPSPLVSPPSKTPRKSRNRSRTTAVFPASRAPSGHTLRTLIAGSSRGWTVLSNNRGAVGKVAREMGVSEGHQLPSTPSVGSEADNRAAVWVVNPSSLSEWRRLEVVKDNGLL